MTLVTLQSSIEESEHPLALDFSPVLELQSSIEESEQHSVKTGI